MAFIHKIHTAEEIQSTRVNFLDIVRKVGDLAFRSLIMGQSAFSESQILDEVSQEAFKYGYFSGHKDCRLLPKGQADVFIDFIHRSIQEFFGSLYFVLMLDEGKDVEELVGLHCEKPFIVNPLFLNFCLYLPRTKNDKIEFNNKEEISRKLVAYVRDTVDHPRLNFYLLRQLYPALDIKQARETGDEMTNRFIRRVLSQCNKTRHLMLRTDDAISLVLTCRLNRECLPVGI